MTTVGVVIPVYYGKHFLSATLDSVFSQRQVNLEVVVVEDGTPREEQSTDLVTPYPARYLLRSHNLGVAQTRWEGLLALSPDTPYVTFLDQDDWWEAEMLSTAVQILDHRPHVGWVVFDAMVHDSQGTHRLYGSRIPALSLTQMQMANRIVSPSQVVIRRTALTAFTEPPFLVHNGADDWLLWLMLMQAGWPAHYVPQPLVHYRDHPDGLHHRHSTMRASEQEIVERWFPALGFLPAARRHFVMRTQLDRIHDLRRQGQWRAAGKLLHEMWRTDPSALAWTVFSRIRNKVQGYW